jgi:hypothetical protein
VAAGFGLDTPKFGKGYKGVAPDAMLMVVDAGDQSGNMYLTGDIADTFYQRQ